MKAQTFIKVLCLSVILTGAHISAALPNWDAYVIYRRKHPEAITVSNVTTAPELQLAPITITEMRVRSEIALRYACTSVITRVRNTDMRPQEATFRMLLPDTAFITNFTMILGGISYKANVTEKEEASRIYSEAVSQGFGAAHINTKARDSNQFNISVNLEGNTTAIFDLRYEELLVRRNGIYNHAINLHTGLLIPKLEVIVHIRESQKITKLFVPEVRTGNEIDATEKYTQNSRAVIKYGITKREVTVTFTPDLSEQERLAEIYERKSKEKNLEYFIGYEDIQGYDQDNTMLGQFVIQYDIERCNNSEILVNDGYFVHFLAPTSLPPLSKHVVFVLDTSASMTDRKIEQLRYAMGAMLSDLKPNDYFNIVEFHHFVKVHELKEADDEQSEWKIHSATQVPPSRASPENIAKAKIIVSELQAFGETDIYSALEVALDLINVDVNQDNEIKWTIGNEGDNDTVEKTVNDTEDEIKKGKELEPIIIFLSDGEPNVGETSTALITMLITKKNSVSIKPASLYSLAFGESANRVFLRELSLRNEGFMRHIYDAADAALQLHDFYRQVSSPLLSHVQFLYPRQQIKEGSVSQNQFRTINAGSEVVVVGEIAEHVTEVKPQIVGLYGSEDGLSRKYYESNPRVAVTRAKDEYLPLERLWAYLTIKQLLDKRDAGDDYNTDEDSPEKKALAIALKYAFVTPLTSLTVVKPNEYKSVDKPSYVTYDMPVMVPVVPAMQPSYSSHSGNHVSARESRFIPRTSNDPGIDGGYAAITDSRNPLESLVLITSSRQRGGKFSGSSRTNRYTGSTGVETNFERFIDKRHIFTVDGKLDEPNSYATTDVMPTTNTKNASHRGYESYEEEVIDSFYYHNEEDDAQEKSGTRTTTTIQPPIDFAWMSTMVNTRTNTLTVLGRNARQASLMLGIDIKPPKYRDEECSKSMSAVGANETVRSVCVYITRCYAARNIAPVDYQKSYCYVDKRYAGICCPRDHIDFQ